MEALLESPMVGPVLGILGLVVSSCGLFVTFKAWGEAKAARTQATLARTKAQEAVDEVRKLDTLEALMDAIRLLEEIKKHHIAKAWLVLLERYSAVRERLVEIEMSNTEFLKSRKARLTETVMHIADFQRAIEAVVAGDRSEPKTSKWNNILSTEIDELRRTLHGFRTEFGVGND